VPQLQCDVSRASNKFYIRTRSASAYFLSESEAAADRESMHQHSIGIYEAAAHSATVLHAVI